MTDKKKLKINIRQPKHQSSEGFKELIDEYYSDLEKQSDQKKKNNKSNQRFDDFDLLNFLDYEIKRLEKINQVFTNKIPNYIDHPQAGTLLKIQDKKLSLCEKELIEILIRENSPLQENINNIFKKML